MKLPVNIWEMPQSNISPKPKYNKTLHVSDSSSVHHQEFFTDPARKLSANLYDIYH